MMNNSAGNPKRAAPPDGMQGASKRSKTNPTMPPPSGRPGTDTNNLTDALFSADIDLADEEALLFPSTHSGSIYGGSYVSPAFLSSLPVTRKIHQHMETYDPEVVHYLSQAAKEYLYRLLASAVVFARHRRTSTTTSSDVSIALRALAAKEREAEEARRQKKAAANADGGPTKPRQMTEDAIAKSANATAAHAVGGRVYSWMQGGSKAAPKLDEHAPQRKGWREDPGITLRDLLLAMDGEGRGLDKGHAKIKD